MDKVQAHKEICEGLNGLYARKNHDYGDSFTEMFEECGMMYSYMHLKEKLNRIKTLALVDDPLVASESIEDSLMDLANYAIMTVIEIKRTEQEAKQ